VQVFRPVQTSPEPQAAPIAAQRLLAGFVVSQQPLLHVSPAQQGSPGPPQPAHAPDARHKSPPKQSASTPTQRPALQHPPAQTLPGQHGSFGPPQCAHVVPTHSVCACVQVAPVQQARPRVPQPMQVPAPAVVEHFVFACVQKLPIAPEQQPASSAPHPAQAPAVHWPAPGHCEPSPTHSAEKQQPPSPHALPGQHIWFGAPHGVHVPLRQ
jgi:hypothetical protein